MAILESARGDTYNNTNQNYLWDWARRTSNLGNLANYYVEDRMDGSTGMVTLFVRDIADKTAASPVDPANPPATDMSAPSDTTVAAEAASNT
jgi:hypothetical protein